MIYAIIELGYVGDQFPKTLYSSTNRQMGAIWLEPHDGKIPW